MAVESDPEKPQKAQIVAVGVSEHIVVAQIETEIDPDTFHVNVVLPPEATTVGEAEKIEITGTAFETNALMEDPPLTVPPETVCAAQPMVKIRKARRVFTESP